jgi:hypothetical protein
MCAKLHIFSEVSASIGLPDHCGHAMCQGATPDEIDEMEEVLG